MFQSKMFSLKFNSFHEEERREGVLGFKITSIQEEKGEEEFLAATNKMETRRKFGRVDSALLLQESGLGEVLPASPLERQDSEVSNLSAFSEVDLDEFYVEDSTDTAAGEDDDVGGVRRRLSFKEDLTDVSSTNNLN